MRALRCRFSFTYEGTWRGDGIVKGRRRDTAISRSPDRGGRAERTLFETWLNEGNFGADGVALNHLSTKV
jgi:hypothetical protein